MQERILAGTAKGLVEYHLNDEGTASFHKVHFLGFSVNLIYFDPNTDRWWVGLSHKHWGQKLHFSDDKGKTWYSIKIPSYKGLSLPNGKPAMMRQVWCLQSGGGDDKQGHLWMGTDPGGLFYSEDNGASFHLVEALWNHPSRQKQEQWFGAGSDYPFIHSIVVDPRNTDHVYIAVSCAGVFKTEDGGKSWVPKNKGLKAAYLPNPNVEVGHDPHRLVMFEAQPDILWQQNHCGIYVSRNAGDLWVEVSGSNGFPYYGFAIAIDEVDPAKAWVFPVESDENRISPDLKLQVLYTENFGEKWIDTSAGLPSENTFDIVLRHSAYKKNQSFVMGTANGNLYLQNRRNGNWECLSHNLTKVNTVLLA
jgi:hypothetical protein